MGLEWAWNGPGMGLKKKRWWWWAEHTVKYSLVLLETKTKKIVSGAVPACVGLCVHLLALMWLSLAFVGFCLPLWAFVGPC